MKLQTLIVSVVFILQHRVYHTNPYILKHSLLHELHTLPLPVGAEYIMVYSQQTYPGYNLPHSTPPALTENNTLWQGGGL